MPASFWLEELVRLNVDVIIAPTTIEVRAAKGATRTIPIVFYNVPDPVGPLGLSIVWRSPGETSLASAQLTHSCPANGWKNTQGDRS